MIYALTSSVAENPNAAADHLYGCSLPYAPGRPSDIDAGAPPVRVLFCFLHAKPAAQRAAGVAQIAGGMGQHADCASDGLAVREAVQVVENCALRGLAAQCGWASRREAAARGRKREDDRRARGAGSRGARAEDAQDGAGGCGRATGGSRASKACGEERRAHRSYERRGGGGSGVGCRGVTVCEAAVPKALVLGKCVDQAQTAGFSSLLAPLQDSHHHQFPTPQSPPPRTPPERADSRPQWRSSRPSSAGGPSPAPPTSPPSAAASRALEKAARALTPTSSS